MWGHVTKLRKGTDPALGVTRPEASNAAVSPFFSHSRHLPSHSPASKSLERASLLLSEGPLYFRTRCRKSRLFHVLFREILLRSSSFHEETSASLLGREGWLAASSPPFWPLSIFRDLISHGAVCCILSRFRVEKHT